MDLDFTSQEIANNFLYQITIMMDRLYFKNITSSKLESDKIYGFINKVFILVKRKLEKWKKSHTKRFDRSRQDNAWNNWTTHSHGQHVHRKTLKGTLVHECRTSDEPLCALRCLCEICNPKAF
jgi:hypothetical protein